MSALWAADLGRLTGRAAPTSARKQLRAVPRPAARLARMPFLGVLIAVFALGMAGLLVLNTTLQNQTFQASTLKRQATELTYAEAALQADLTRLQAPQELARRASAAGLRPNPYPAQLELPSGKVTGKPTTVSGNEAPLLVVKSPAELAKERAAAAAKKQAAAEKKQAEVAQQAAGARQQQLQAEQAQQAKDAAALRAAKNAPAQAQQPQQRTQQRTQQQAEGGN